MSDWYFAYGSNMNAARMRARGLEFSCQLSGSLQDCRLVFNKRAGGKSGVGYANVCHAIGERVEGVLYQLAVAADISCMDVFEGTPVRYSRELFAIDSEQGPIHAWVYIANPAFIAPQLLPEAQYLQHLLAGRELLSQAYYQRLSEQAALGQAVDSCQQRLKYNA